MYQVGIDIGDSSIKVVVLDGQDTVVYRSRRMHQGSPLTCLQALLDEYTFEKDQAKCVLTGSGAELLQAKVPQAPILETVPALVAGVAQLAPQAASIIQMGAQTALFIAAPSAPQQLDTSKGDKVQSPFAQGMPEFVLNEDCAAGTGSFFEDQMQRLGLPLEEYSPLVEGAKEIPRLSGRCSVFAKTDIIHRQQEGVPVEDILLGLCYATVKTFKATIVRNTTVARPVALVGGTLLNSGVVRAVKDVFELADDELFSEEELLFAQAYGACLEAKKEGVGIALSVLEQAVTKQAHASLDTLSRLAPLPPVSTALKVGYELAPTPWNPQGCANEPGAVPQASPGVEAYVGQAIPCALGIDVGSTSTNLVLVGLDGRLLDAQYLRTRGNPRQAVKEGLASLEQRVSNAVRVVAVGATGSGRRLIGSMVGADVVRDEITAQARAAVAANPDVDTVFEIGGQDSKYISIHNGQVADFQMNKVCAAGTGSFIEEQAARLDIPLADYGALALGATAPVDLGERCTVFVETATNEALAKGASKADIAAGLCESVVRNYLHKVVGTKPVGARVVLQGGVAYNPAIVAAFSAHSDNLTVSPWFAVSGAVGVALLALEDAANSASSISVSDNASDRLVFAGAEHAQSAFKGWDLSGSTRVAKQLDHKAIEANKAFFGRTTELFLEGYDSIPDPAKKTVGIPRCLTLHKLFPMANAFFKELGYNVLLTDESNEDTIARSQQFTQAETCFPVKLVHGHMSQLVDAQVDYVFMPTMHTIRHASSTAVHDYACPYMQSIPTIVARELEFEKRGITLLSPEMNMEFGQQAMATAMLGVGAQLGATPQQSARAMLAGGFAVQEFTRKTEELGDELFASLGPDERVLVIVTRNYGTVDPALNMDIPNMLLDRGQKVITISHLHAHDLDLQPDHSDMYWPFGQHMLSAAKLIARDPRLFAVYLTNHGCGPDTMLSHQIREEMGSKPYLHIETDEHFSKVGVETRIEAFLNAIEAYTAPDRRNEPTSVRVVNVACEPVQQFKGNSIGLPSYGPYGSLVVPWLERAYPGAQVSLVSPNNERLQLGRAETTSKEYYTFASLLGLSLSAVLPDEEGALPVTQLLLSGSLGGEADGQYARSIRTVLDENGATACKIAAPALELLPGTIEDIDGLFLCLLAGDIVLAAPIGVRAQLMEYICARDVSLADVSMLANQVYSAWQALPDSGKASVAAVGEWPLVASDELTGGMWALLEEEGYRVVRAPLSEYLWFLWDDAREEACKGKPRETSQQASIQESHTVSGSAAHEHTAGSDCSGSCGLLGGLPIEVALDPLLHAKQRVPSQEEWKVILARLAKYMNIVHQILKEYSPFSDDVSNMQTLATDALRSFAAGNGRYRYAKAVQLSSVVKGTIMVASMYENVDTVLRMSAIPVQTPLLHLAFDGPFDRSIESKLRSFLYYI